ncbi:MAG: type transporter [Geminicoccaceae bacterium]|nr:type transporter [Geminicoccaceae bacterium]
MMREIGVVMRKELKEMGVEGGGRRGRLTPIVGVIVAGVVLPLNFGVKYVLPGTMMAMGVILPLLFVLPIVADTFAGERERHTLETLLATRLPDHAILFGKVAAIVGYAFVLSVVALILGVVAVNVAHPEARPLLAPALTYATTLVEIVLAATLMTGIGVLISLGAPTVRQAQQRFSMVLLVPMLIPAMVGGMPAGLRDSIREALGSGRITATQLVLAVLLVLNAVVLGISMQRFRRSRLIA